MTESLLSLTWPGRRDLFFKTSTGCSQTQGERQGDDPQYLNPFSPCRLVPFPPTHQINTLTSPPAFTRRLPEFSMIQRGKKGNICCFSTGYYLLCFLLERGSQGIPHTGKAFITKGRWNFISTDNDFRCHLLGHFQILKTNIKGSKYFCHLQDWSDKLLALFKNASVFKNAMSSQVKAVLSTNPIISIILFIFCSWRFIILIFKCDLSLSRI